jgi:2-polyprenyl-3-methyl-5-hydroxy-6-metoxy-1,4-benzoquinol methylase
MHELEESEERIKSNAKFFVKAKETLIRRLVKGPNILDVGCGLGANAIPLAKAGLNVTAIDISQNLVDAAKEKAKAEGADIEFIVGDVTKTKLSKKYETILMADVLEHVEDDEKLIGDMKKLLTDNGTIIAIVPALESLRCPRDDAVGHIRRYGKSELREKFMGQGLHVKKLRYWKSIIILPALFSRIRKEKEYSAYGALNPVLNTILGIWFNLVENALILPIGETLIITADKKT